MKPGNFLDNIIIARKGVESYLLPLTDIVYFYSENKVVFLKDKKGSKYISEKNLLELEMELRNHNYFRSSKNSLINIEHIKKFRPIDNGRLEVLLHDNSSVIVSQLYASTFRKLFRA